MNALKKNKPLISIIIVNWNGMKWLKKCLSSLSAQTYRPIEIIVVDNKSSDNSLEYIKKHFRKVRVIESHTNGGFAVANNIGVQKCTGKYILFLNTDIWVERTFIHQMYQFYCTHTYDVISPIERRYFEQKPFKCNTTLDITVIPAYYFPKYTKEKQFYLG